MPAFIINDTGLRRKGCIKRKNLDFYRQRLMLLPALKFIYKSSTDIKGEPH